MDEITKNILSTKYSELASNNKIETFHNIDNDLLTIIFIVSYRIKYLKSVR